jgi:hypothetical protein
VQSCLLKGNYIKEEVLGVTPSLTFQGVSKGEGLIFKEGKVRIKRD